jgi:hypothetical protein
MTDEQSAGGIPIYRYERSAPEEISRGDAELGAAVEAHLEQHIGTPDKVFHELISPYVHVDVHIVEPHERRPARTLMTSGMAERPMPAPDDDSRYAELTMILPPDWPEAERWPFALLQELARLPHEFDTWLWSGHTVPYDDPPRPYTRSTKLCGALLAPPLVGPEGFERFTAGDREISVLGVIPLHADEMQLKLDQGTDALYDLLDEAGVTEILDPQRPSVVPRRRRGLFRR